jgi:phosphatidylserine/phosphatidylglycerophosphate/cardiolipin synthase-like enzyme
MTEHLLKLSDRDLQEVASALRSGRLPFPFSAVALQRIISRDVAEHTVEALDKMSALGFGPEQIEITLDVLRKDRARRPRIEDVLDLVTTGPDVPGVANRDTSVVVRELFANAKQSVLVAGYAVYQGHKVFQALADRMLEIPNLSVRLFLDIQRPRGDTSGSPELIRRFASRFRQSQWPKDRPLPEVYFDPRSVDAEADKRACLHAKTIVVDSRYVFVSSANFTEAAHLRNIEIGVAFDSLGLAHRVSSFFDVLLAARHLVPVVTNETHPRENT